MKPKKKSSGGLIIAGVALIFTLFIAVYTAIGYENAITLVEQGNVPESNLVFEIVSQTINCLTYNPTEVYINEYTQDMCIRFGAVWLVIVLMILNSQKNYIHGKEFGTARWGTLADVKDLFAKTIAQKEIQKARRLKTKLGRFLVKREEVKRCEKDGQIALKKRLTELDKIEAERKRNKSFNKQIHQEEVRQIKEEVRHDVAEAKIQAWKPDLYKRDCVEEIAEIRNSNFFTDEEKKSRIKQVEEKYKQRVDDFFDYNLQTVKIKEKYEHADMLFSQNYKMSFYNYVLNQNVLILGGAGAGKTRGYVMPNVLQALGSYVISDPKGEILEKSGYFLEKVCGYKIRVLNLDEKSNSEGYNPFVYIHPDRAGYEERVLTLIETIIINTDGEKKGGGSDPFWDKAERLFLQSIFFFTVDGFVPEQRNMSTVMKLIAMLEIGEEEDNFDSDLDYFAKIMEEKFGADYIGVQQYKEFRSKASGKTAKSIVISAVARLAPFRTSEVRRIFSYDNMQLDRVGEEKYAIFVVTPPTDKSFNFIAGMLYTQLFQELQYCALQVHKHDGQRLPVPCKCIFDEFANSAEVPNFPNILSYARSLGISITIILQSLEQIKSMYEKEWGVIVDNCNTILYLGSINHEDTLDYISKLLGKGTFDKRTTGRTRGRQGSSSENFDVVGRELMLPDEIRKMPKDECLVIFGGRPPLYDKKYKYETHENYRLTSDGNKQLTYYYKQLPMPTVEASHGENIVIPTLDSVVDKKLLEFDANEDNAKAVEQLADDFSNDRIEFLSNIGTHSDEEYLALIESFEQTNISTLEQLTQSNAELRGVEENKPKIEVLSAIDSIRELGRSFRKKSLMPMGFIDGVETNALDKLPESRKEEIVKVIDNALSDIEFEEEKQEVIVDNSLDDTFADNLDVLLDNIDDSGLLDESFDDLLVGAEA